MIGYISSVAQQQMSIRNNPYFDINVKTSLSESMHLWLMGNSQSKKTLFLQKHEVKSPVKFPVSSPTKSESFFTIQILVYVAKTSSRCHLLM